VVSVAGVSCNVSLPTPRSRRSCSLDEAQEKLLSLHMHVVQTKVKSAAAAQRRNVVLKADAGTLMPLSLKKQLLLNMHATSSLLLEIKTAVVASARGAIADADTEEKLKLKQRMRAALTLSMMLKLSQKLRRRMHVVRLMSLMLKLKLKTSLLLLHTCCCSRR
jgi:hypothetical protein